MSKKKYLGIIGAFALMALSLIVPPIAEIGQQGTRAVMFTLAILTLLVTEGFSAGVTALIVFVAQPILGLTGSFAESSAQVGHTMFFFMLAAYGMSAAMTKVPVSKRLLRFFIRHFGKSTKGLIFALCVSTAILSTLISNFPTMMMFYPIFVAFLDLYKQEADRKKTGKTMFLLLPLYATIGCICTPVGNGCMMLGASLLADAGFPVSFPMWFIFGGPCALILLFVVFVIIVKLFPPAEMNANEQAIFVRELDENIPKKMRMNEKITYFILAIMLGAWFFTSINATLVMCLVMLVLLFPAFNIITWDDLMKETNWSTILLITSVISVASALTNSGVSSWIATVFIDIVPASVNPAVLIFMLGIFTYAMLILVPTCSAVTALIISPFIAIMLGLGLPPIVFILPLTFYTSFALILPYDVLFYVPYQTGYFTLKEFSKTGIIISLLVAVVFSMWIPIAGKILGMI